MSRTHEDIKDELLVLQCQDGDSDALKALTARWQPLFFRLAWRLTSHHEVARDVVQDSWLAIVRGLRGLDDPALFRSWAYRIIANKCVDCIRRRVVRRKAEKDAQVVASWCGHDSRDEREPHDVVDRLRYAMKQLSDEQRAILSLHYLDGMGIAEIARVLSVPPGTVKSRLYHARNRLKHVLERVET